MPRTPDRRLPTEVWEILAASAVLAWRVRHCPADSLWRDWLFVLAAFWIVTAAARRSKAWPVVLGLTMAFLFAVYAVRQVPLSLAVLGALR